MKNSPLPPWRSNSIKPMSKIAVSWWCGLKPGLCGSVKMPHRPPPSVSRSLPEIGFSFFAHNLLGFVLFVSLPSTAWLALNTTSSFAQSVSISDVLDASGNPAQVGDTVNQAVRVNQVAGGASPSPLPDTVGITSTLDSVNDTASVAVAGQQGVEVSFTAGTLNATVLPEVSLDGGVSFASAWFIRQQTHTVLLQFLFTGADPITNLYIGYAGAITHARIRVSVFTGGSNTATLRAATTRPFSVIYGTDSLGLREILVDTSGHLLPTSTVILFATQDGACPSGAANFTVAASNSFRSSIMLNASPSNTDDIFIKLGVTATTADFRLAPGQALNIPHGNGSIYTGQIDAIPNTGTQAMCIIELNR